MMLKTPQSDATAVVYDNVSVLESNCMGSSDQFNPLGYMALAAMCSSTQVLTISSHHLNHMAFAVTVMNGVALIASGQQLHSTNRILLEPLLLNEGKAHNDWHKWQEAMASKMASMDKMNIFELADIPTDGKLICIQWVYKLKLDTQCQAMQYKACLVAQGYAQHQGLD
ncbi:hypothetical protein NDA13_003456 [Ustilago tritici]|nr:hypothetical protein NDA13_003456 [Ustilago tritici]